MGDTMHLSLLPMMVHRPNLRPASGLLMPLDWRSDFSQMGLEVVDETVTDGKCGIHAFATGLLDVAKRDNVLSSTSQFKQALSLRNDLKGLIAHVRRSASKWMRDNVETIVWGDMPFKTSRWQWQVGQAGTSEINALWRHEIECGLIALSFLH